MTSIKLVSPFDRTDRQIMIEDRVWYIPPLMPDYNSFTFPGWNHPLLFNNDNPVFVEYCSGNGDWIAKQAAEHREVNWVAVEKKFDRVSKIWSKIKRYQLDNVIVIYGEGYCATQHYFPTASVKQIFINFPDPWPKTRHAKHRIIQPLFIKEMHRILQLGGTLTIVTDDENYSHWLIRLFNTIKGFQSEFPSPYYVENYPGYGTSYFEDLWRQQGRTIRYHLYKKIEDLL